jgi:hypothetical protein
MPDWSSTAEGQLGLITAKQLAAAGVTAAQARRLRADGILAPLHRRVYRVAGAPATISQRRLAAVLAREKGVLSHRAAAAEWGAERLQRAHPELVVPANRSGVVDGVIVHRSRDLKKLDVFSYGPFPRITRPALTLVHLGNLTEVSDRLLERVGSDLLLGWPKERNRLRQLISRPHPGATGPSRILDLFGDYLADDRRPPHPGLEVELLALLRSSPEIPPPVVHLTIQTAIGPQEVDFAWPDAKLIVEADSTRWHSSPEAIQKDRSRDQALAVLGFLVLRFTTADVRDRPGQLLARVAAVLTERLTRSRVEGG